MLWQVYVPVSYTSNIFLKKSFFQAKKGIWLIEAEEVMPISFITVQRCNMLLTAILLNRMHGYIFSKNSFM